MEKILEKLRKKENLNFEESKSIFEIIMSGQAKDEQIYDFLTLLSDKGESPDEIAGGVLVLRNKAKPVNIEGNVIDTCGTGGDGKNTLNISIELSNIKAFIYRKNSIKVTFIQSFKSNKLSDIGIKELFWKKDANGWKIIKETWRPQ